MRKPRKRREATRTYLPDVGRTDSPEHFQVPCGGHSVCEEKRAPRLPFAWRRVKGDVLQAPGPHRTAHPLATVQQIVQQVTHPWDVGELRGKEILGDPPTLAFQKGAPRRSQGASEKREGAILANAKGRVQRVALAPIERKALHSLHGAIRRSLHGELPAGPLARRRPTTLLLDSDSRCTELCISLFLCTRPNRKVWPEKGMDSSAQKAYQFVLYVPTVAESCMTSPESNHAGRSGCCVVLPSLFVEKAHGSHPTSRWSLAVRSLETLPTCSIRRARRWMHCSSVQSGEAKMSSDFL